MKAENRPDLLYSVGKVLFSIPMTAFCTLLLIGKHEKNIRRLIKGEESKLSFGKPRGGT